LVDWLEKGDGGWRVEDGGWMVDGGRWTVDGGGWREEKREERGFCWDWEG